MVPLMGPQSIIFPPGGLGRLQQGLLLYSCAVAPALLSLCWPWLAVGYSQPLIEPHFTGQWCRHPVDESLGLFCHIRLGAGHLQLNDTPTDVLRERRQLSCQAAVLSHVAGRGLSPKPQLVPLCEAQGQQRAATQAA